MSKVTAGIGKASSGIGILTGLAGGTKANTANLFLLKLVYGLMIIH